MGASGWSYFTEWQNDAGEALEALRQEVFEKGEFGGRHAQQEIDKGFEAVKDHITKEQFQELMEMRAAAKRMQAATNKIVPRAGSREQCKRRWK
jgi:hypothetical protein